MQINIVVYRRRDKLNFFIYFYFFPSIMSQIPLNEIYKKCINIPRGNQDTLWVQKFESNERVAGADIQIIGRRNKQCQAKIMGTAEQIKMVVKLLRHLGSHQLFFTPHRIHFIGRLG